MSRLAPQDLPEWSGGAVAVAAGGTGDIVGGVFVGLGIQFVNQDLGLCPSLNELGWEGA